LGNILLSPTCQALEFPGLSTVAKFIDIGSVFPLIPIVDIQKLAIDSYCISPSEVTAELLLAPRTEKEAKVALVLEDFFPNEVVMWLLRWRGRVEGSGGRRCAIVPMVLQYHR
jgi:hypothetical protein